MLTSSCLLTRVLVEPESCIEFSLKEWDLVLRQSRRAILLSRLATIVSDFSTGEIPELVMPHLVSSRCLADKQLQIIKYEVDRIEEAFRTLDTPVVLLKGAAYVAQGLPPVHGRLFSDIDILVKKDNLDMVEQAMSNHGWMTTHLDEYDQHYYRKWMHELPPMKHLRRSTVVDIHHSILPETAHLHPDPKKLLADIQLVSGYENVYTLSDIDMVLHSATHLFFEGELEHGLRDLVDLDALLRHFSKDEGFWDQLVERAAEMDLMRPLYYALRYTQQMLQTPVPDVAMKASEAIGKPPAALAWLMDALFRRALMPDHPSCDDAFTPLARWVLYIRSHYLRMPFHLLIPHLVRKAIKKRFSPTQADVSKLEEN